MTWKLRASAGIIQKMDFIRKYRRLAAVVALVYVAISAGLYFIMRSPALFNRVIRYVPNPVLKIFPFKPLWFGARLGRLRMGDHAPEFTLPSADGKSTVSLASFHGQKPVVLVFGSYTSPPLRREVPALNLIYDAYKDRAAFYMINTVETPALGAWGDVDNPSADSSVTPAQPCPMVGPTPGKLGLCIPALIDNPTNSVEEDYTAWPDRLYVIDRLGRVAYKSNPGPFGFNPDEMESVLKRVLAARPAKVQTTQE